MDGWLGEGEKRGGEERDEGRGGKGKEEGRGGETRLLSKTTLSTAVICDVCDGLRFNTSISARSGFSRARFLLMAFPSLEKTCSL